MFVFQGSYIQVGDIVSVVDTEGDTYYAQIRGLLTDQYCEKSAVLTWLLPTIASPAPALGFDPATYIMGKYFLLIVKGPTTRKTTDWCPLD